jgi:hypothetical protein
MVNLHPLNNEHVNPGITSTPPRTPNDIFLNPSLLLADKITDIVPYPLFGTNDALTLRLYGCLRVDDKAPRRYERQCLDPSITGKDPGAGDEKYGSFFS